LPTIAWTRSARADGRKLDLVRGHHLPGFVPSKLLAPLGPVHNFRFTEMAQEPR
jgi:hypothetical protein